MLFIRPRFTAVLAAVLLLATNGLQAATVTYSTILPTSAVANPLAGGLIGADAVLEQNVTGTIINNRRSPWDATNSTVPIATGLYSSIRSKSAVPASAFFTFASIRKELSFVWGTPGPLNKVEFFLDGLSQFAFSGVAAQILSNPRGNKSIFTKISGLTFDKVVFTAGKPALEFANLRTVSAVPIPAAGLMLLGALGGLAALRRRKTAA